MSIVMKLITRLLPKTGTITIVRSIVLLGALSLSACLPPFLDGFSGSAGVAGVEDENLHDMPLTLSLYTSRTSLTDADFEQYDLRGNVFHAECGRVNRGRHTAEWQETIVVEDDALLELKEHAHYLLQNETPKLAAASEKTTMFEPGKFSLDFQMSTRKKEISCSFDSISESKRIYPSTMRSLYLGLRSLTSEAPCGDQTFYGVGRATG